MSRLSDEDIQRIAEYIVKNYPEQLRGMEGKNGQDGVDIIARGNIAFLNKKLLKIEKDIADMKIPLAVSIT